jgi:hypothetical protein
LTSFGSAPGELQAGKMTSSPLVCSSPGAEAILGVVVVVIGPKMAEVLILGSSGVE